MKTVNKPWFRIEPVDELTLPIRERRPRRVAVKMMNAIMDDLEFRTRYENAQVEMLLYGTGFMKLPTP